VEIKSLLECLSSGKKTESKAIPIFLLSRLPEVTVCSCSTSNDLYDVKSPLVQVTVVSVEILRRFGTKNLPLFGDEEPGAMETEALPDSDVKLFLIISNISLSLFAELPKSASINQISERCYFTLSFDTLYMVTTYST
jgi:hypothetical protein